MDLVANARKMMGRAGSIAAVVAVALVLFGGAALATATSNVRYLGRDINNPIPVDVCGEAIIADTADNKVNTRSYTVYLVCGTAVNSPSGYLGASAYGYRSGSYCGTTGYYYSSVSTWKFSVGAKLCSNPSGSQTFHTVGYHRYWDWNASQYVYYGTTTSPMQNY